MVGNQALSVLGRPGMSAWPPRKRTAQAHKRNVDSGLACQAASLQ